MEPSEVAVPVVGAGGGELGVDGACERGGDGVAAAWIVNSGLKLPELPITVQEKC